MGVLSSWVILLVKSSLISSNCRCLRSVMSGGSDFLNGVAVSFFDRFFVSIFVKIALRVNYLFLPLWCNGGAKVKKKKHNYPIIRLVTLFISDPGEALYLAFNRFIISHFSLRQNRLFPICTPSDFNVLRHTG